MARTQGSRAEITGPAVREAARRLFARQGFAAVSMRQIAAEVGLQVGALYAYTPELYPTGLRGTPPHLDLLALREGVAVAVTVRCIEYLSRRKAAVAPSYDRLLAAWKDGKVR